MLLHLTSPKSFLGIWMLRSSASPQPLRRSFRSAFDDVNLARRSPSGTLDFKLCNGYANQLLSLFYGAVLALESNRQMVIPKALLDGTQASGENNLGTDSELVDVGRLWDRMQLLQALRSNGVKLLETEPIYQASSTYLVPNSEDLLSSA